MYLSMHILADSLKDYRVDTHILSGEMCIRNAAVFLEAKHYNPHIVYIAASEDIIRTLPDSVVCINRNDYFVVYDCSIEEVYERLLEIIDFYQEWDQEMRDRIAADCSLSEITDRGAEILRAMVGIMNTGFIMQAVSGKQYAEHISERDLEDVQIQVGLPLPHVSEYSDYLKDHLSEKGPYVFYEPVIRSRFVTRNILINGWLWGFCYFSVEDEETPESKKQLFQVLYEQIRSWWERNSAQAEEPEQNHFFLELLRGSTSIPRDRIWEYLNRIGWAETDEKYLCLIRDRYDHDLMYLRLMHQLSQAFSHCYVLDLDDQVALVVNSSRMPIGSVTDRLKEILAGSRVNIGISYPFRNLIYLPQYREQAQIALEEAARMDRMICFCSDSMIPYFRSLVRKNQSTDLLLPTVRMIREYDEKHGTQYDLTLQSYLREERSIQRTAEVLHIHKNTLLYRIRRMEELFPLRLEDSGERERLLLNYMIYGSEQE